MPWHGIEYLLLFIGLFNTLSAEECVSGETRTYNGTVSTTLEGFTCLDWNDPTITDTDDLPKIREELLTTEGDMGHNSCRNPVGGNDYNPWCYHKGARIGNNQGFDRWGYCKVKRCPGVGCYDAGKKFIMTKYRGKVDETIDGEECISWNNPDIQDPLIDKIRRDIEFLDGNYNHNYCRKPLVYAGETPRVPFPWCFTKDALNRSIEDAEQYYGYCVFVLCIEGADPDKDDTRGTTADDEFSIAGIVAIAVAAIILFTVIIVVLVCCCLWGMKKHSGEEETRDSIAIDDPGIVIKYVPTPRSSESYMDEEMVGSDGYLKPMDKAMVSPQPRGIPDDYNQNSMYTFGDRV